MQYADVMTRLRSLANADNVAGMARFGINPANTLGVSIPALRKLAREAGRDHALALRLWRSGVHEARILAAFVDDPAPIHRGRWSAGRSTSIRGTCATRCAATCSTGRPSPTGRR